MNGIFYNNASMEATTFIIPDDVIKILIFSKRVSAALFFLDYY